MKSNLYATGIVLVAFLMILLGCEQEDNITTTQSIDSDTQKVLTQDNNILDTPTLNATKVTPVVKQLDSTTVDSDATKTPVKATSVVIDENVESSAT